jgi:hypothetical protein
VSDYLIAFLVTVAVILVCLFVLGLTLWSAHRQAQRKTPRRVRPARADEFDLAAERYAYVSRQDAFAEARDLRRVA